MLRPRAEWCCIQYCTIGVHNGHKTELVASLSESLSFNVFSAALIKRWQEIWTTGKVPDAVNSVS